MSSKEVIVKPQDKMFTKGFMQWKSNNKKPDYFANIARNVRIRNGWLTCRDGFIQLFEGDLDWVQGIVWNNGKLLFVHDNKLKTIDLSTNLVTDIQTIDSVDDKVSFITYWIYTIILTWVDYPRVYNWSTCTQLTSANLTDDTLPTFWVRYAWFTVINSNAWAKNAIKISRPVAIAAQNNSYMRDLDSGSESITYDWEVLGLEASMNFLWIFTKTTIEKITKDNLTTAWGIQSLYSLPIAKWQEVLNNDSIVSAWDSVFFITSNMQVASIEYQQTNQTDPALTILSDRRQDWLDVQDWLSNLNPDQSKAFGIFDKKQNCVKWFLRSFTSTVNDVCLVYDITNKTWYTDDNKYYSCICEFNNNYYAWWAFNWDIYQEEVGKLDWDDWIDREYSVDMVQGSKFRKKYLWAWLSWVINYPTVIKREVFVDDMLEFTDYIQWLSYSGADSSLGIGWAMMWERPIAWEIVTPRLDRNAFNVRITDARLRANGDTMTMRWSGNEKEQDFVIDYLDISYKLLRTIETKYKF